MNCMCMACCHEAYQLPRCISAGLAASISTNWRCFLYLHRGAAFLGTICFPFKAAGSCGSKAIPFSTVHVHGPWVLSD